MNTSDSADLVGNQNQFLAMPSDLCGCRGRNHHGSNTHHRNTTSMSKGTTFHLGVTRTRKSSLHSQTGQQGPSQWKPDFGVIRPIHQHAHQHGGGGNKLQQQMTPFSAVSRIVRIYRQHISLEHAWYAGGCAFAPPSCKVASSLVF